MKTLVPFIQGFTAFSAIVLFGHLGAAYAVLRFAIVWLFVLAAIASLVYGLFLVAKAFFDGQGAEVEQSVQACLMHSIPALVLLIIIMFGGLTGVITGW